MPSVSTNLAGTAGSMESLGRNCEFGLVQRRAGVEPLGLLRFAESPLDALISAIECRFEGLKNGLTFSTSRTSEWLGNWSGLTFHADRNYPEFSEEFVRAREAKRLPWLAAKLMTDIEVADKMFVYCGQEITDPSEVEPLLRELRRIGDARLMIVIADPERAGTIEPVDRTFWIGRVRRLTPTHHAAELDWDSWRSLLTSVSQLLGEINERPWHQPSEVPLGFDPAAYLIFNPDVAEVGMDPANHFLRFGWHEGRRWRR